MLQYIQWIWSNNNSKIRSSISEKVAISRIENIYLRYKKKQRIEKTEKSIIKKTINDIITEIEKNSINSKKNPQFNKKKCNL